MWTLYHLKVQFHTEHGVLASSGLCLFPKQGSYYFFMKGKTIDNLWAFYTMVFSCLGGFVLFCFCQGQTKNKCILDFVKR